MMQSSQHPHEQQHRHGVSVMLRSLEDNIGKGKSKGGFSVKKNTYPVAGSHTTVDSWRMQEWDYKKPHLPTYARGLFTATTADGHPEIVARGYDKFFNHNEVPDTQWEAIEANTRGPYELSVKENGCIIFISGLEDGALLVCSKHSTGSRGEESLSHAEAGEKWVDRHLARVGKNRAQLAQKLREMKATAVAELCDDEFEEHVLAYTPETAGLYLHGINVNHPVFSTYPHDQVDRFAEEWGFKKTTYIVRGDIREVKAFLDGIAETGHYEGRDTEGFVVRCQSKAHTDDYHDWFFKYKFDEPYLMYRQWRECTKAIIADREPKYKKHKKITEDYLRFARMQLHGNPELAKAYQNNHGIIKMRDDFLASRGLRGYDIIRQEAEEGDVGKHEVTGDVMLVPVATIGCGKTTVALALCKLFQWGHVQNDNITVKKGKPAAFARKCVDALTQAPAMVADRNNHQKRERNQLIEDASRTVPNARFVCMQYVHDRSNYDRIRQATRERVLNRGDNHQTIQVETAGSKQVIEIMDGFMKRFEPVDPESPPDDGFDTLINLDPCATSRDNLETVITALYTEYPKLFAQREMPSAYDMDAAIAAALNDYTVDLKHEIKSRDTRATKDRKANNDAANNPKTSSSAAQKQPKDRRLDYFALHLPAPRIHAILDAMFRDATPDAAQMYTHLRTTGRVQPAFHVTLAHRANAKEFPAYWDRLSALHAQKSAEQQNPAASPPVLGACLARFERLVWDNRVMAFQVRLAPGGGGGGEELFTSTNRVAHVTVGTSSPAVKPVESNVLLERWGREGAGGSSGMWELGVHGNVELEGWVAGVLQRR